MKRGCGANFLYTVHSPKYLGLFCVGSIQPKPNDNSNNEIEQFWASKSHGWHCNLWIQCQIKMAIYHNVLGLKQRKSEKEKIFIIRYWAFLDQQINKLATQGCMKIYQA